jgi:hypothetical protein
MNETWVQLVLRAQDLLDYAKVTLTGELVRAKSQTFLYRLRLARHRPFGGGISPRPALTSTPLPILTGAAITRFFGICYSLPCEWNRQVITLWATKIPLMDG